MTAVTLAMTLPLVRQRYMLELLKTMIRNDVVMKLVFFFFYMSGEAHNVYITFCIIIRVLFF